MEPIPITPISSRNWRLRRRRGQNSFKGTFEPHPLGRDTPVVTVYDPALTEHVIRNREFLCHLLWFLVRTPPSSPRVTPVLPDAAENGSTARL
jgi:hypothetical protein